MSRGHANPRENRLAGTPSRNQVIEQSMRILFHALPLTAALSFIGGLAAAVPAGADEVDVYGRINLTLQDSDEFTNDRVELRNNASRVGVKGELAIDANLKAIYQLEFGVNIDGDSSADTFTHRNQFVGLEGGFGTVKVGRHDTALKEAQGDFDLFNDLEGDIAGAFNGENRLRNYIGYTSPALGEAIHITVNVFPGEDPDTGDDGVADGASFSIDYETDHLYLAIAHDRDLDGAGVRTSRLAGGYPLGPVQLMLLYQRTEAGAIEEDGVGVSLAWTHGRYVAKFQYLTSDLWLVDPQDDPLDNLYESVLSVGLDREFGERTRVFGFYTTGDIGGSGANNDYLALGIEHQF
jgi:predicted porin